MEEKVIKKGHSFRLTDRGTCQMTGVKDVIALDEAEVLLETEMGVLTIRGKELHMKRLTLEKGEVDLEGTVNGFSYSDAGNFHRQGDSFLKRIFK